MKYIKRCSLTATVLFLSLSSLIKGDGDIYYWFDAITGEFTNHAKQSADDEIKEYPDLPLTITLNPGYTDFEYGYTNKSNLNQPVGNIQQVIKIYRAG